MEPIGQLQPVAQPSAIVAAMSESWRLVSDLLGGTKAMRNAGTRHLPKWEDEKQIDYDKRLTRSTLFPAFSRTITTLAAKPFSRPITYNEDVPPDIKKLAENDIDMMSRDLDQFAADCMAVGLAYGLGAILVDFPDREGVPNNRAAEKAAGLRPYWARIEPHDILGWIVQSVAGKDTLTQFRYFECVDEVSSDGYTVNTIRQIKVLNSGLPKTDIQNAIPSGWEIWRMGPFGKWYLFKTGTTTIGIVPVVPFYGTFVNFFEGLPPLLELAYLNVKHWQSQSDQDNLLTFARVPILTVTTDDTNFKLKISGNVALRIPLDAKAEYVEPEGTALGAGKTSLDDLKDEMRQSGAELLVFRDAPATATEINDDASVGRCALQKITQTLQDSLNTALQYTALWMKLENGGTCKLFNEFGGSLDDIDDQLLCGLPDTGKLSVETLFAELQRRWNIAPGVKWDDEALKIKQEADDKQARAVDQATKLAAAQPQVQPFATPKKKSAKPATV